MVTELKVPFVLVANKCDHVERVVDKREVVLLGVELNASEVFETSALTGAGVEEAFRVLTAKALKHLDDSSDKYKDWPRIHGHFEEPENNTCGC